MTNVIDEQSKCWPVKGMQLPSSAALMQLLRGSRLFAHVPESTRRVVAVQSTRLSLRRGERIYRAGERAFRFTSIVSGIVKLTREAADGCETIHALFGPRESIGAPAVVERGNYFADAVVATPTADVFVVEAAPVLALSAQSVEVAAGVTRVLLDHIRAIRQKVQIATAGSATQRLATLFLSTAERFGDEHEDGSHTVPVPLTRADLASFVDARVETTIRIVRLWERRGLLETRTDGFRVLDVAALHGEARRQAVTHEDER